MIAREDLGEIRRQSGARGLDQQKVWREHALFLAADFLALEFLTSPEKFRNRKQTYEAYLFKTALHKAIANAVLSQLRTDGSRITTPGFYTKSVPSGRSRQRVALPPNETPSTIKAPKSLKPETVRKLFQNCKWRQRLDYQFAERVKATKPVPPEYSAESDASVMAAAEKIRRLIERG